MANHIRDGPEGKLVVGAETVDQHVPGGEDDLILEEHLEKALEKADDGEARYHLRAALQRLELA